jgi:TRAP-type C4-dicarboxylate transport system substrate-binding protein
MFRRAVVKALGALALVAGIAVPQAADAAEVLKIGTLAPKSSPWGKVFSTWEKAVKEKSGGNLELQFFYNGQQGDEGAMVGKMKSGQLDGSAVTAVGLGKIYKNTLAMQMPGLFVSWPKLDAALDVMKGDFEKGTKDAGFTLVGWGHVGQAHLMSKGFAIKTPDDMKGKKPYMWRDDSIQPILYQIIGVTPVPLNIPELLPALNSGSVNVVTAPSLAAEQLQWSSRLDHIQADVAGTAIGALVFSTKRLDALPADLRTILNDTGKVAASALTKRIRDEDTAAFGRLKGKMTVVTLSGDEQAKWASVFKQVRSRLGQGTFSPELVTKLEGLAK